MNIDELLKIDKKYRDAKPKLFQLSTPDRPATELMINGVEERLGLHLPASYKEFLRRFGGGSYGLIVVFSADSEGSWYLPEMQAAAQGYLPENVLAVSDDFAGGNYVFPVVEGVASECLLYWNADGGLSSTPHASILDYVAKYAYEPA